LSLEAPPNGGAFFVPISAGGCDAEFAATRDPDYLALAAPLREIAIALSIDLPSPSRRSCIGPTTHPPPVPNLRRNMPRFFGALRRTLTLLFRRV
jgi:hypothetical protein